MFAINLGGGGGSGPSSYLDGRSGTEAIGSGQDTVTIVFTDLGTTGYALIPVVMNYTDPNPIFIPVTGVTKTMTGFEVSLGNPTDTANYVLEWVAVLHAA